jgi:hypothetical protein
MQIDRPVRVYLVICRFCYCCFWLVILHVGRVGFSCMHEGCRDDRIFSFRFGVGAGGCMQGRVACRSRSRRVATHVVMCWRCELWLEFMIRIAYRECSGHTIDTVATLLVRIGFVLHTTARMLWPMFEVIAEDMSRRDMKDWKRLGWVRCSGTLTILIVDSYYSMY